MIDGLKPYPRMKDSGVEWLGEVPEHWEVLPIGRLGQLFKANGGSKADEAVSGVPCVRYGDLYTKHEVFIREPRSCVTPDRAAAYTSIRYGDVLFAASGETIEDIGKSAVNLFSDRACCGGDVLVLRPALPAVARFLGYAADAVPARQQKACMGRGFTVVHIYGAQLRWLALALPPVSEQAAIARFLDYAERRIRRYIRAKQKLFKLVEEQKQALVHHAVTRGLDPNVRLKPSGVDWLGNVPEHWEVQAFTRTAVERADYRGATPAKTQSGVFLVTAKNIRKGWIDYQASKEYVAKDEYSKIMRRGLPRAGDLLLTTEAPLGHAALVDRADVALAQRVIRFRLDPARLNPEFALLSVLSPYFQNQLLRRGTGSTALGIKATKLPELRILCPPVDEQGLILEYVESTCRPMDSTLERAQREIALLREYRTRLIADVVTGKLDVREAAARLPAVADDAEPLDDADDLHEAEDPAAEDPDGSLEEIEA